MGLPWSGVGEVVIPDHPLASVVSSVVASVTGCSVGTSYPSPRITRMRSAASALLACGALSMPSKVATDCASVWAPGP